MLLYCPRIPTRRRARSPPGRLASGAHVGVLITDTLGRAWREGQTDHAIGARACTCSRICAARRMRGPPPRGDLPCVADELAAATDLVKGRRRGCPSRSCGPVPTWWETSTSPAPARSCGPPSGDMFALGSDEAYAAGSPRAAPPPTERRRRTRGIPSPHSGDACPASCGRVGREPARCGTPDPRSADAAGGERLPELVGVAESDSTTNGMIPARSDGRAPRARCASRNLGGQPREDGDRRDRHRQEERGTSASIPIGARGRGPRSRASSMSSTRVVRGSREQGGDEERRGDARRVGQGGFGAEEDELADHRDPRGSSGAPTPAARAPARRCPTRRRRRAPQRRRRQPPTRRSQGRQPDRDDREQQHLGARRHPVQEPVTGAVEDQHRRDRS